MEVPSSVQSCPGYAPTESSSANSSMEKDSLGSLPEIQTKANFFQRAFSVMSVGLWKPSSSYTKANFKEALTTRYGQNIADKVMSAEALGVSGTKPDSILSLAAVVRARDFAEFLESSGLDSAELATSATSVYRAAMKKWDAAIKTLEALQPTKRGAISQLYIERNNIYEQLQKLNKNKIFTAETAKSLIALEQKEVNKALEDALTGIPKAQWKAVFKRKQIEVRNEQEWKPIDASVTTTKTDGRTKVSNQTTITPASNFMQLTAQRGGQTVELGGICSSNNDNQEHAINLAIDVLHAPEGATEDPTDSLLTVVRSGVDVLPSKVEEVADDGSVSKRKVTDEEQQTTFDKRFDEGLVACLQSKRQLEASAGQEVGSSQDKPLELEIADIGFLSHWKGEEKAMQTRQFEMLQRVHDQTRQITFTTPTGEQKTIWVKPKILAFNFGVEWGDRGMMGAHYRPAQWTKTNEESITSLMAKAESSTDPVIVGLKGQLQNMCTRGDLYNNVDDYYAFAARVILLSDKLGMVPKIHCKSGKDRTSRAIEAAKALALEIQNSPDGRTVPDPSQKITPQQKMLRQAVALNSGNQEVQELNTDFRGNKQYSAFGFMEGISYLASTIAGYTTTAIREYQGLADLAKR